MRAVEETVRFLVVIRIMLRSVYDLVGSLPYSAWRYCYAGFFKNNFVISAALAEVSTVLSVIVV